MRQLVLATRNKGKIAEFERMLNAYSSDIQVLGLADFPDLPDVDETGASFIENSLLKAREVSAFTQLPALADDSGLCIDALNGDPGIFSARWAGVHGDDAANIAKVLAQLSELESAGKLTNRNAKFRCAVALSFPTGHQRSVSEVLEVIEEGELLGSITLAPRGTAGFGYDPIFQPNGYEQTLGEFEDGEKDRISHRAQALAKIAPKITSLI
jgi:XTP/dITP diphosphohydrolase